MTPTSDFSPRRWLAAVLLLAAGFALLAFALLMDVRVKQSPYDETPTIVVSNANE